MDEKSGPKTTQNTNRWVCLIRNDRMGDLILTLPVLQAIKDRNHGLKILLVCSTMNAKIASQHNSIDDLLIVPEARDQKSLQTMLDALSHYKIAYAFNCVPGMWNIRLLAGIKSKQKASMIYYSRYKSANFLSTIQDRMTCWQNSITITAVDRLSRFRNNKPIHQTEMIHSMVSQFIPTGPVRNVSGPTQETELKISEPYVVVHASGRWIKKSYTEKHFIDLIEAISESSRIVITTDESSSTQFSALYKQFPLVTSKELHDNARLKQRVLVADQFPFDHWQGVIAAASGVITVECGWVHLAALFNKYTINVYDIDNAPEMIYAEYKPWTDRCTPIICPRAEINPRILQALSQLVPLRA